MQTTSSTRPGGGGHATAPWGMLAAIDLHDSDRARSPTGSDPRLRAGRDRRDRDARPRPAQDRPLRRRRARRVVGDAVHRDELDHDPRRRGVRPLLRRRVLLPVVRPRAGRRDRGRPLRRPAVGARASSAGVRLSGERGWFSSVWLGGRTTSSINCSASARAMAMRPPCTSRGTRGRPRGSRSSASHADAPRPLVRRRGASEAIVAGFFVRDPYRPLGEVRIGGSAARARADREPWAERRACVHVDGSVRLAARRDRGRSRPATSCRPVRCWCATAAR